MLQILGLLYQCEEYACLLHIILLRAHFSQNVKYWYEIRDILVPVFHGVIFAKCEICGSTMLLDWSIYNKYLTKCI